MHFHLKKSLSVAVLALLLVKIHSAHSMSPKLTLEEDIEYWDIDSKSDLSQSEKDSIKKDIISQLSVDPNDGMDMPDGCQCPRIFGPVICDNYGKAHINICLYLCAKRKQKDLSPRKVLLVTKSSNFNEQCKL